MKKSCSPVLVLLGCVVCAAVLAAPPPALGYPDHAIQLVIPNVPGAAMDITGRMLADELGQIIGQRIIPNNKPGAGTVLGSEFVVRAKKDGYTLLYSSASAFVYAPASNPAIVRYDPIKDIEPIGLHYFFAQTFAVRADAPWKTFQELVDYAKKNPGKLRVSTIGVGSVPHFDLEMVQSITGARFTHVPFEGGESVITAVLGGHVEVVCDAFNKLKGQMEAGKMRVLLMTNKMAAYPKIPTISELGYKGSLPGAWFCLYAPAGIPDDVRKVLVPATEKAVRNTKAKVEQLGNICEYKTPQEVRKMTEDEYKAAVQIAVKIGLRKP